MKKFRLFEILLVIFVALASVNVFTREMAIKPELIPTVINGLVSSISMIIGFTGAIMIFTLSKRWDNLKLGNPRPMIYIVFLCIPIALLWTMYNYFFSGDYYLALNIAIIDFAMAAAILIDFIAYYERETIIHMRENTVKARQGQPESEKQRPEAQKESK